MSTVLVLGWRLCRCPVVLVEVGPATRVHCGYATVISLVIPVKAIRNAVAHLSIA